MATSPLPRGLDQPPTIPARTHNLDSKKRHTLAVDQHRPARLSGRPNGANRMTLQPASTEVISSLISSLSAISTPAQDLFDQLLPEAPSQSTPNTPLSGTFPRSEVNGTAGSERSAPETDLLHPDDVALPPVVRTAKPPSGYSSLTASKRKSLTLGPTLSRSSPNLKRDASRQSIGSLSIEPGAQWSSDRLSAWSDGSGRSKTQTAVNMKSSKEKVKEIDRERRRKEKLAQKDGARGSTDVERPRPMPLERSFSDNVIPKGAVRSQYEPSHDEGPSQPGVTSPSSGHGIPARDSSLRPPGANKKRASRRSYHSAQVPTEVQEEQPHDDSAVEVASPSAEGEDPTERRIKELKERKQRRDESQNNEGLQSDLNDHEARRRAQRGRASLPAPSTNDETSPSPGPVETPSRQRRGSDPTQKRPPRFISPSPAKGDRHHRVPSNAASGGRPSFAFPRDERPSFDDGVGEAIAEYINAPRLSQKIYHPQSGRAIAFSDVGDPEGSVVFCCLGMGTTRYLAAFYDELAATLNLRLITLDRPGIGESEPYRNGPESPLAWPDDVRAVCAHLGITRFSVLAHSAGAIYALATALRMPRHIRGRIHLLAPWIPPSQMVSVSVHHDPAPVTTLPMSQRVLRSLPTPWLRAANSSWFSMTSTSFTTSVQKSPKRNPRRSLALDAGASSGDDAPSPSHPAAAGLSVQTDIDPNDVGPALLTPASDVDNALGASMAAAHQQQQRQQSPAAVAAAAAAGTSAAAIIPQRAAEQQAMYDARLTQAIWTAATANAHPAVDLLVCLERVQPIGFRYVDVTRPVRIAHGARDTRVPAENVRWLGAQMRSCEVTVLPNEGHGLMANPLVMGDVLSAISQEWEEWLAATGSAGMP